VKSNFIVGMGLRVGVSVEVGVGVSVEVGVGVGVSMGTKTAGPHAVENKINKTNNLRIIHPHIVFTNHSVFEELSQAISLNIIS
jgi:hypothetical protein